MAAHPDTELIPYVQGELPAPERERVAQHLRECLDCRRDADELRELLDDLGRAVPRPPDVHWGGYRAELREKLAARRTRRDRKSTRLNSSHTVISYAVFCLKKKKNQTDDRGHSWTEITE